MAGRRSYLYVARIGGRQIYTQAKNQLEALEVAIKVGKPSELDTVEIEFVAEDVWAVWDNGEGRRIEPA